MNKTINFNFNNPKDNVNIEELCLCQENQYPIDTTMVSLITKGEVQKDGE